MPVMKRAVSEDDKERRKEQIINAAWAIYKQKMGNIPQVDDIASKAGVSKGTIYVYFSTKEEIYLAVFERQIDLWVDSILEGMDKLRVDCTSREMADVWVHYPRKNQLLLRLMSQVYGVLDNKSKDPQLLDVKTYMALMAYKLGNAASIKWPHIDKDVCARLAFQIYSLIIGLWQHLTHAQRVNKMVTALGITLYDTDMIDFIRDSVETLIRGTLNMQ